MLVILDKLGFCFYGLSGYVRRRSFEHRYTFRFDNQTEKEIKDQRDKDYIRYLGSCIEFKSDYAAKLNWI